MPDDFSYRPKFVDIRVKKSRAEAPRAGTENRDPVGAPCDHVDCKLAGEFRAPKGRDREGQFWHFCREHVAEYNKRWNYFAGMNDAELAAYRKKEEIGHRPTWTFRSGRLDQHTAAQRSARGGRRSDPFGMFGNGEAAPEDARPKRRLTRLQTLALEAMSLDEKAGSADIRTRYAELVKRWHPDSNGGDRSAEAQLQRVIKAYQTLKASGLV